MASSELTEVRRFLAENPVELLRSSKAETLLDRASPVSRPYCSPLNPVFLTGLTSLDSLAKAPHWLARDGKAWLSEFFARFERPGFFRGVLHVHHSCVSVVPRAWAGNVRLYRVSGGGNGAAKTLVLLGLATPEYCSLGEVERLVKAKACKKFTEILVSVPHAVMSDADHDTTVFHVEYSRLLFKTFGRKARVLSEFELLNGHGLNGAFALDLSSRELIADNYLLHRALERGASLLDPSPRPRSRRLAQVPHSLVHGVEIFSFPEAGA